MKKAILFFALCGMVSGFGFAQKLTVKNIFGADKDIFGDYDLLNQNREKKIDNSQLGQYYASKTGNVLEATDVSRIFSIGDRIQADYKSRPEGFLVFTGRNLAGGEHFPFPHLPVEGYQFLIALKTRQRPGFFAPAQARHRYNSYISCFQIIRRHVRAGIRENRKMFHSRSPYFPGLPVPPQPAFFSPETCNGAYCIDQSLLCQVFRFPFRRMLHPIKFARHPTITFFGIPHCRFFERILKQFLKKLIIISV